MLLVQVLNHAMSPDDLSPRHEGGKLAVLGLIVQKACSEALGQAKGFGVPTDAPKDDLGRHVMVDMPFNATFGGGKDLPLVVLADFVGWPAGFAADPGLNTVYAERRQEARAELRKAVADALGERLDKYFSDGRPLRIVVREADAGTSSTWSR